MENEIINFWFPNNKYQKMWFISNNKFDQMIYDKYYLNMTKLFDDFNIDNYTNASSIKILTDIILLDQFSRNISRVLTTTINIYEYTKKAELLSILWIERKYYLTEPIHFTVFAFLPIRHIGDKIQNIKLLPLLELTKENITSLEGKEILRKFTNHTIRSLTI